MSIALSNAIPPVQPQPVVLPVQVQLAQGAAVAVTPLAVTANDKREEREGHEEARPTASRKKTIVAAAS